MLAAAGAGLPVPPGDPAALAAAIRGLRADPAAAAAMGRRGRAFVAATTPAATPRAGSKPCCAP